MKLTHRILSLFAGMAFTIVLAGCGGGGDSETGAGMQNSGSSSSSTSSTNPADQGSQGGGSGAGPGGGSGGEGTGGEGAGLVIQAFFFVVDEITSPSAPANQKQLVISVANDLLSVPSSLMLPAGERTEFTTNNGAREIAECEDASFVSQYESELQVDNQDCNL